MVQLNKVIQNGEMDTHFQSPFYFVKSELSVNYFFIDNISTVKNNPQILIKFAWIKGAIAREDFEFWAFAFF